MGNISNNFANGITFGSIGNLYLKSFTYANPVGKTNAGPTDS